MTMRQELSNVTQSYLSRYYEILDEMICGMTNAECHALILLT